MHWYLLLLAWTAWGQSRDSIEKQLNSVARQRDAIRQAAAPVLTETPPPEGAEQACAIMPAEKVAPLLESAAKAQRLPAKLLHAVVEQESGYRACAVSGKGAKGLMQLMPATAEQFQVKDAFDPRENLDAGAKFLRQLLEKYKGDLSLSLAAYNAGAATVDAAHGIPDISETRDYVEAIVGKMGIKQIDLPSIPTPKPIEN
jgi:soluble lytic murein transglycosylase-like protein